MVVLYTVVGGILGFYLNGFMGAITGIVMGVLFNFIHTNSNKIQKLEEKLKDYESK